MLMVNMVGVDDDVRDVTVVDILGTASSEEVARRAKEIMEEDEEVTVDERWIGWKRRSPKNSRPSSYWRRRRQSGLTGWTKSGYSADLSALNVPTSMLNGKMICAWGVG